MRSLHQKVWVLLRSCKSELLVPPVQFVVKAIAGRSAKSFSNHLSGNSLEDLLRGQGRPNIFESIVDLNPADPNPRTELGISMESLCE